MKKLTIPRGIPDKIKRDPLFNDIRDTFRFEEKVIGFPERQGIPRKHFEFKFFIVLGKIATGKSTLVQLYFGNKLIAEWGIESIGMILARDIWATVKAIIEGDYRIYFIMLDDSVPAFDSRRSTSKNNVNVSQFYYEIRHELRRYSMSSGKKAGGLVFMCLIAQDYYSIDTRLRNATPLRIFKSYDRAFDSKEFNFVDYRIKKAMRKIEFEATLTCDYDYRKLALGIDVERKYSWFFADSNQLPHVPFTYVTGEDIFEQQKDELIHFLVDTIPLGSKVWYMRGKLREELRRRKKAGDVMRIYENDLNDIVELARTRMKDLTEEQNKIANKNISESQIITQNNSSDGWIKQQILILHDTFDNTFEEVGQILRIPKSTAHDWYHQEKDRLKSEYHKQEQETMISIKDVILKVLATKINVNRLIACNKEELRNYISLFIDPRLYLGQIDIITDLIFEEIQKEVKKQDQILMKELVVKPLNKQK